jgi:uncharacterized membrane protein YkoI
MRRFIRIASLAAAGVLLAATTLAASPRAERSAAGARGAGPGYGMMGSGMMGGGMMGPGGTWSPAQPLDKPLTLDGAEERAIAALKEWGYTDLEIDEVVQYTWNIYVLAKEKSTGRGALELLVDPRTGSVSAEPGPNMMWNTKYGHRYWSGSSGTPAVSVDQAKKIVREWLAAGGDRTDYDLEVTEMYGYYSIHLEKDMKMTAMVGVNAWTGQVWYHTWHGDFVAEKAMKD